jgi:hypothetical protein
MDSDCLFSLDIENDSVVVGKAIHELKVYRLAK